MSGRRSSTYIVSLLSTATRARTAEERTYVCLRACVRVYLIVLLFVEERTWRASPRRDEDAHEAEGKCRGYIKYIRTANHLFRAAGRISGCRYLRRRAEVTCCTARTFVHMCTYVLCTYIPLSHTSFPSTRAEH